jgi:hypothetical protein
MSIGWIVLGIIGWGLGVLFLLALCNMSAGQDRAALRAQKLLEATAEVAPRRLSRLPDSSSRRSGRATRLGTHRVRGARS